ncbi:hypothetical protein XI04_05780 [Bradyrhizobium sp. CCBAU 11430]|uniref:Uncharacterized protein n=1 Tax=Bradyrhizobium ottawaense TaxID=931866 RepID=A0A2U8PGZ1_9BRAD|nr:hypothetical protein CIT37_36290 [Bradyrhizobium ottawaense]MDA9450034.1 hypothetical protein [Bradyrhizobium sp. CCBAU 21360]MDA9452713.1 hypothetical protein [Bradyrhizobium sp. CCBAU 21359]MDA9480203.1 hypothetical protein [Bradyrhizobium sp. CCBAU 65884]MDA9512574.1 hypothetical protein [Bradyrhizobium sp. CCBAU 11430]
MLVLDSASMMIRIALTWESFACDISLLGAFAHATPIAVFLPSAVLPPFVLSPGAASIERAG